MPVAAHAADCVLTLPLYADLPLEDVDRICDCILDKGCTVRVELGEVDGSRVAVEAFEDSKLRSGFGLEV